MQSSQQAKAEAFKRWEEYVDKLVTQFSLSLASEADHATLRIHYSERYCDDKYEYRHVILPKPLLKLIPKQYYKQDDSGTLRLLSEREWRGIGITQSLGWVHYETHCESRLLPIHQNAGLTRSHL